MKCMLFYSWQSDLPSSTNRGFIQQALEQAAAALRADDELEVDPVVDRDTSGVPGSPDIARTIFEKIDKAAVFVGDISIVTPAGIPDLRPSPNPNVLIELGYALKSIGPERTLMVMNTAFGKPELLPFDLKLKRVLPFNLTEGAGTKAAVRKELARKFEDALRPILADVKKTREAPGPVVAPGESAVGAIQAQRPDRQRAIKKFMEWFIVEARKLDPISHQGGHPDDHLVDAIGATGTLVDEFGRVAETTAAMNDVDGTRALFKSLEMLLAYCYLPRNFSGQSRQTDFEFYKFLTHELTVILAAHLVREERWQVLSNVFSETLYRANTRYGQDVQEPFDCLSDYLTLLDDVRTRRLEANNQRRISFHADILKERHERQPPVGGIGWEEFLATDFLLYLRSHAHANNRGLWWAPTAIYLGNQTPRFLVAATTRMGAQNLAVALDHSDVVEMSAQIKIAADLLVNERRRSANMFFSFLRGFDFDKIGST
jgi:hypothetical protein